MEALYSHAQAAKFLNVSEQTLFRMGDNGEIARIRIGQLWRYDPVDIREFLARNKEVATVSTPEETP